MNRALALVLAVAVLLTGCAGTVAHRTDPSCPSGLVSAEAHGDDPETGLTQARGGEKAALLLLLGLFIGFVVALDLLILPVTCHSKPFYCTRAVVVACYR
jgi:uncharacterized protein YceK